MAPRTELAQAAASSRCAHRQGKHRLVLTVVIMLCRDWPSTINVLVVLEFCKACLENSKVALCIGPITLISKVLTIHIYISRYLDRWREREKERDVYICKKVLRVLMVITCCRCPGPSVYFIPSADNCYTASLLCSKTEP